MAKHPYSGLADHHFWSRASGHSEPREFDPVVETSFVISPDDGVVTAGSCFAQHVARHLRQGSLRHMITEKAHPAFSEELAAKHNYGMFAARYGNVYTARQLKQLLQRAYGEFVPMVGAWQTKDGTFVDPFRPQIQPGGYVSEQEAALDRRQHLGHVRRAIEGLSVFVFTLGLTEAWSDQRDGAVYPIAPGVAGGEYNPAHHEFINFGVADTVADLEWSLRFIRTKNPNSRIILTVSPVPLNATFTNRDVVVATTMSKAVLRVAAEMVSTGLPFCDYFPSYEIITSSRTRGRYFTGDMRTVAEEGVEHVMSIFFRHYAVSNVDDAISMSADGEDKALAVREHTASMAAAVQALCDEELLDKA